MTFKQRIEQLEKENQKLKEELHQLKLEKKSLFNKGRDSMFNEIDDISANSPFYAALIDCKEFRIEQVNQIYNSLAGFNITGLTLKDALHEDFWNYYTGILKKVCRTGKSLVKKKEIIQFNVNNHPGKRKIMDLIFYPVKSENGEVEKIFMLSFEIEKQVRQKKLLEHILDEIPVGVALHEGPEFITSIVNKAYYDFAYGKGDIQNRKVADVWPEVADQIIPLLKNVYETGKPYHAADAEFTVKRNKKSEKAWFTFSYLPFKGEEDKITGILVWSFETTRYVLNQRRISEMNKSLQQKNAQLEAILNSIPDGYIIYDNNLNISHINPLANEILALTGKDKDLPFKERMKILGIETEEGKPVPVEKIPVIRANQGENVRGEIIKVKRDGKEYWLSISASPIISSEGNKHGVVMQFSNITQTKESEIRLREREALLNAVVETMPAGVLITSKEGQIIKHNSATLDLWGLPPETKTWKDYGNWVGWWPDTNERIKTEEWAMSRALNKGETTRDELIKNQKFNSDEMRYYLNNVAPLYDSKGNISGGVAAMLDVTERLTAERKLKEAYGLIESITEGAQDMIAAIDLNYRYTYFNDAYYQEIKELWDHNIEIGSSMEEAMQSWPSELEKARELWDRALNNESFAVTMQFGPSEKEKQYYDLRLNPLYNERRQVIGAAHFLRNVTEEIRIKQELSFERERLHSIVDNLSVGLIFFDSKGERIEIFNKAAIHLHGFKNAEDFLFNISDYPNHFDILDAANNKIPMKDWIVPNAVRGNFMKQWEAKLLRKDNGHLRYISYSVFPIFKTNGEIANILLQMVDITNSKHAEEAIRRSEERWNLAIENFSEAVIIANEEDQVIYWNPAARAMHGFSNETEGIGPLSETSLTFELWNPDQSHLLELDEWPMRRIKRGERLRNYELILKRPDQGWEKYVSYSGSKIETAGGEKLIYLSVNDLTEQRESEKALRESEKRFRSMADNISQLAWMADKKGWIFWFNQRWYDYTGTTLEEVQGWGWKKVQHPDHVDRVVTKIQHSWNTGEKWEDLFPLRGADGQYRWFLSRAVPIRDENGKIILWFGTNTDVTEQRKSEQILRKNNELFENILYIIAHDLKGPIGNMYMSLNLIDSVSETDKKLQLLGMFRPLVERLESTIKGVTSIVQVQKGEEAPAMRIHFESLLNDIILENKENLSPGTIKYDFSAKRSIRYVEPFLTSIMRNLIGNAIKFSHDNTPLSIEANTSVKRDFILLKIKDNGIGIDLNKHREQLFSPFKRIHPNKAEGTGVGLYIIKSIIEKNGGHIAVESEVGKGTTFYCYLKEYELPQNN